MKALNQSLELMLQNLASILCASGAEYCNRVAVQIAEHRCQTGKTVVAVVGLLFLIPVQLDICRVHVQKETAISLLAILGQQIKLFGRN